MFSGSMDAGFVLAVPFHHRYLEPDSIIYGRSFDKEGEEELMQGGGGGGAYYYGSFSRYSQQSMCQPRPPA